MKRNDILTLQEAADVLGVHYMTAYRYVRTGRLAATQVDGKWHVRRSSLAAIAPPAPSGRPKAGTHANLTRYVRSLTDRLVSGDDAEVWLLTQKVLGTSCSAEDLVLDVLGPALRRVGDEWAAGRISVAEEHRATASMHSLVGRLRPLYTRRGRTRGVVVIGAPEDDFHGLPSALVADVLRGRGFSVTDLGANTPAESFVETIAAATRLVGVGVAVSTPFEDATLAAEISVIRAACPVPLVLGGTAIRDAAHALALGADIASTSAREAVDAFDALAHS
jgi:MerR family transcriptional regulator, light-induced transcriptional regulator